MLTNGQAYRCVCSKERLEKLREQQKADKQKPRYDGCCRDKGLAADCGDHVIRFRNPAEGEVVYKDLIHGDITVRNSELDDLIIARTDGTPTYNFTVVVDDSDMAITHVIRGDDHVNNTPRQINMFKALGFEQPIYAHVPMILGDDGKRLSKRHGAVSVMQYREDGYLPEALLNYLVRLGWSHGDQEIFSTQEMCELFDLGHVNKSAAAFNTEKLMWLNQHYQKTLPATDVAQALIPQLEAHGLDVTNGPDVTLLVEQQAERCKTLVEMAEKSLYFYQSDITYDEKAQRKFLKPETVAGLQTLLDKYSALESWDGETLHQILKDTAEELDIKLGKLAQPLRVAVTGNTVSPPMDATLALIGRERVLARLQTAVGLCGE